MTRPARVVIDLAALRYNFNRVRELAPGRSVMAIVKADAYGHGIARVAAALEQADAFGVACLEEAAALRDAGVRRPVVLLEGPYGVDELASIAGMDLDIVVHHKSQIDMLAGARAAPPAGVWLKIDSGMHRLGFGPEEAPRVYERLSALDAVRKPVRLMTHLAVAGDPDNAMTERQLAAFTAATRGIDAERSIANSAGILAWPGSHADWVRPGLMLYGVSPLDGTTARSHDLRAAMTLKSRLISVKRVRRGEPVGYGAAWTCPADTTVGVVAAGYADGFPRHAGSGTPVLVNGRRACTAGNASMDMLTVDLGEQPEARVGDEVELWGAGLPIEELAQHAGTIPYEILCGVHKRLTYVEHGEG